MNNYKVIYEDMPTTIGGFVKETDGFYTIVINARMAYCRQLDAYLHELRHIAGNDFDREETADHIELEAHRR